MRGIILAAGEGTRLRPHTADRPKCLVPLGGRPLLDWQLRALRAAGIDDITIVTGYRVEMIEPLGIATRHNPAFATTNMVASLMCARDRFDGADDVLIAYGDIVYEPRIVTAMLEPVRPISVAVDMEWRALWELRMSDPLADAETLRIDAAGCITELGRVPNSYADIEGQYLGLIAVRADFAGELIGRYDILDPEGSYEGRTRDAMFMTVFLQLFIDGGTAVGSVPVRRGWIEVDTIEDLAVYEQLLADGRLDAHVVLREG